MPLDADAASTVGDTDDNVSAADRRERRAKRRDLRVSGVHRADADAALRSPPATLDGSASPDPLCHGRRVGDTWEVHGTRFRVGPDGRRLRLELVKRVRTRYVMPADSEHPDRAQDVEYYTEAWLTEDEYAAAKVGPRSSEL
jgi:hypothetical protein